MLLALIEKAIQPTRIYPSTYHSCHSTTTTKKRQTSNSNNSNIINDNDKYLQQWCSFGVTD